MPDCLAAAWPGVEDNPVAVTVDALRLGYLGCVGKDLAEQILLRGLDQLGQGPMVRPRDHQDMHGRLRVDVEESDSPRRLGHDGGRYLAGDDAAEQAIWHGEDLNV